MSVCVCACAGGGGNNSRCTLTLSSREFQDMAFPQSTIALSRPFWKQTQSSVMDKLQQIQPIKETNKPRSEYVSAPPSDWASPALSLSQPGRRTFAPCPVLLVCNPCLCHAALQGPEVGSGMLSVFAVDASCGGTVEVWDPAEAMEVDLRTGGDHRRGHPCFQVYPDLEREHKLFVFEQSYPAGIITPSNGICF